MELTKRDSAQTKGLAAIFMLLLHLFCVKTDLSFSAILLPSGVPLVYYIGLFGDQCVAIYCFCSGYAHYLIRQKNSSCGSYYRSMARQLLKFLLQFWTVLLLCVAAGLATGNASVPGSLSAFAGNFFLYKLSYNGAWWFVLTYVFLVVCSGGICFLCKKLHPVILILPVTALYCLCHFQRYHFLISSSIAVVSFFLSQGTLLGVSLLPYLVGCLFRKYEVISKIKAFVQRKHIVPGRLAVLAIAVELIMLVLHGIVESSIVAPFIAIVTVTVLNVAPKPKFLQAVMDFFGKHSTNIWLVHLFFIQSTFPAIAYLARYPIPIFLWVAALSIGISYLVHFLCRPLQKLVS